MTRYLLPDRARDNIKQRVTDLVIDRVSSSSYLKTSCTTKLIVFCDRDTAQETILKVVLYLPCVWGMGVGVGYSWSINPPTKGVPTEILRVHPEGGEKDPEGDVTVEIVSCRCTRPWHFFKGIRWWLVWDKHTQTSLIFTHTAHTFFEPSEVR